MRAGLRAKFAGVYENQKSLLGRETAHNPNPSGGERGERTYRSGLLMKALSGRVRILKNSKLKLRVGFKKRDAMTSDSSKDKPEVFLSGVVEGNKRSFDEKAYRVSLFAYEPTKAHLPQRRPFYAD